MSEAFTSEASIDLPAAAVWEALTDWDRAPEWMDGVESLRADGPTEAGTELTFRARGRDRTASIAAAEPGRSVVIRSVQGGVTADYAYELHDEDGSTRVTLVAECRTEGLYGLLGPVLRGAIRRADSGQLTALKQLLEAG